MQRMSHEDAELSCYKMVHWCCTKHSCKGTKNGIAHQHFLSHADPPRRELFFSFLLFLLHKTAGSA